MTKTRLPAEYISVTQAADLLDVSTDVIRELIYKAELDAILVGRIIRIPKKAIHALPRVVTPTRKTK